jgi:hypothetical protein
MTRCTICRRMSATRPVGDPLYNARVCIDSLPCLNAWLSSLDGHDFDSVLAYVLARVTHTDNRVARCHHCGDMVYTEHSQVYMREGTTKLVMHYGCYIERLTDKLLEPL